MKSATLFRPRLIVKAHREKLMTVGYLELGSGHSTAYIGPTDSFEYKLVQSLFSPSNTRSTRFNPVTQSVERTYTNMMTSKQVRTIAAHRADDMERIVRRTIKALSKTEAGKHLAFTETKAGITMHIAEPAMSS